jgi:hypothetical protein
MPVLPKGGINIAGHKVPWEAIAAIAAVAGVLLVLRARSQGAQVASVGSTPAVPDFGALGGFNPGIPVDNSAQLANITQQLASLSQQTPVAGTPVAAPSLGSVVSDIGGGYIFAGPGSGGLLGFFKGDPLKVTGPAVTGPWYGGSTSPGLVGISSNQYIPVSYGGQTGYIWAPEAHING